jgi:hypothetical protein
MALLRQLSVAFLFRNVLPLPSRVQEPAKNADGKHGQTRNKAVASRSPKEKEKAHHNRVAHNAKYDFTPNESSLPVRDYPQPIFSLYLLYLVAVQHS